MNMMLIYAAREFVNNVSVGEIAGTAFAFSYAALLVGLRMVRSRRLVREALQAEADRKAKLMEKPRLQSTPREPGVRDGCTVLPTCLADLESYYDKNVAFRLAGWISPGGHYYQLPCAQGHAALARCLADGWGSRELEQNGWVHLSQNGTPGMNGPKKKLSRAQIETLTDIAMLSPDTFFGKAIMQGIANN